MTPPHPRTRIQDYIARHTAQGTAPRAAAIGHFLLHANASRAELAEALDWLQETYPDSYAEILVHYPKLAIGPALATTYTTAPADYDGFGSETVRVLGCFNDKPLRQVETPLEHVQWQRDRYGSGLYPAFTEEQMATLVASRWYTPLKLAQHSA
jgi:hypothetical protein